MVIGAYDYVERFANAVESQVDMDNITDVIDLEHRLNKFGRKRGTNEPSLKQLNILRDYYNVEKRVTTSEMATWQRFEWSSGETLIHSDNIRKNSIGRLYDKKTGRFIKREHKEKYSY